MSAFEKLRGDHSQILLLADDLSRLTSHKDRPCTVELFRVRTMLASILIRHLKEEDWVIYPALLRSKDPSLREAARDLQGQVGSFTHAFSKYMERWTAVAIERDWPSYYNETSDILKVLKRRVTLEDRCLFGVIANDTFSAEPSKRREG